MAGYDQVIGVFARGEQTFVVQRFCTVNDLPVMFVKTPEGGRDAVIYDWKSGAFRRNGAYLFKAVDPHADVEDMSQEEFESYLEGLQRQTPPDA